MRRVIKSMLAAGFGAVVAGCATPGSEGSGQELAENTPGQVVRECRYAKGTGSKMRYRVCNTQEEWALIDAATAEAQDTDGFFRGMRENSATTAAQGSGAASAPGL